MVGKPESDEMTWPSLDFTRVPFRVFSEPGFYQRENERLFRGPCWNYLGLEVEVPEAGDFIVSYVGETQELENHMKYIGFSASEVLRQATSVNAAFQRTIWQGRPSTVIKYVFGVTLSSLEPVGYIERRY